MRGRSKAPRKGGATFWGAHAAGVLVLAARQNDILRVESLRKRAAFAGTRAACAPQISRCALSARSFAAHYGEVAGAGVPKLNCTGGGFSAPGCAAKNGRGGKPSMPAI